MNRLICCAAVVSALLATTAVPSFANTVALGDVPPTEDIPGVFTTGAFTTVYDYTLLSPADAIIVSGTSTFTTFNSITPGLTLVFTPIPSESGFYSFIGREAVAPGSDSFTLQGSGTGIYFGSVSAAPLPGTLALFASGLGFLGFWVWNKGRKARSTLPKRAVS